MPHAFYVLSVSKFLDFLFCYGVFYCVDRRLNFILITESLKVSTKASVFVVVTVSSIVLTSAFVNLPKNAYISATVFLSASDWSCLCTASYVCQCYSVSTNYLLQQQRYSIGYCVDQRLFLDVEEFVLKCLTIYLN